MHVDAVTSSVSVPKLGILESAIAILSPRWAAARARDRAVVRSFNGADFNRLRSFSGASLGPIAEGRQSRAALLSVARELDRNNAFATGAFNALADNIVGPGYALEARIRKGSGPHTAANASLEEEWRRWSEVVTPGAPCSFDELLWRVSRELWVAGEALVIRKISNLPRRPNPTINRRDAVLPLELELVESERLEARDFGHYQNEVIQGVEFDPSGRIAAYWIWPHHPDDTRAAGRLEAERIEADRVIHLYRAPRPGAIRGLSRAAPVATFLEAIDRFLDHELTKAGTASAFALMVKRGGPISAAPTLPNETTDAAGDAIGDIEGGLVFRGGPNDSLEGAGPSIQTSGIGEFITVCLRACAAGLNMSYESLARDFSKTNFSSARMSGLEDLRRWRQEQAYLRHTLCDRAFRWFADVALVVGLRPVVAHRDKLRWGWTVPAREHTDPQKEITAEEKAVELGVVSRPALAAKHGSNLEDNLRANAQAEKLEADIREEVGLPKKGIGNEQQSGASSGPPQGAPGKAARPTSAEDDGDAGRAPGVQARSGSIAG